MNVSESYENEDTYIKRGVLLDELNKIKKSKNLNIFKQQKDVGIINENIGNLLIDELAYEKLEFKCDINLICKIESSDLRFTILEDNSCIYCNKTRPVIDINSIEQY